MRVSLPTSATLLVLAAILAFSLPAGARPQQQLARLLTSTLTRRMAPATRASVRSLVQYAGNGALASGVVVGVGADERTGMRRAWVLTNEHVVGDNPPSTASIAFRSGALGMKPKLIAKSDLLDYALLEVMVPDGGSLHTAKLTADPPQKGDHLYSLGAATSLFEFKVKDFLAVGKQEGATLQRKVDSGRLAIHATISRGRATSDGATYQRVRDGERVVRHYVQQTDLAIAVGASGGPVFSSHAHALVGINSSSGRYRRRFKTDITTLVDLRRDLDKKLQRGEIAARYREPVAAFIAQD